MRVSVITPTGTVQLEPKSQPVKFHSPLALLEIRVDNGDQCDLITGKQVTHCKLGINQFHLCLFPKNTEILKIKTANSTVILQFSCGGGKAIDERDIENLMHFRNSLKMLPVSESGQIAVVDLFSAIEKGRITLLSVQKPLTGYDNQSLLDKLQSALKQKVRAICSSPKQGIRTEELVQDVSLVKRINTNTLSHLASHTEHWKARMLNGLIPKRLKADITEDEINIYENLFFKMAVDDIADYTTQQILSLRAAKRQNKVAIDWEAYGAKINDYRRGTLIQKLLPGRDTNELNRENKMFDDALKKWLQVSKIMVSIRSSVFYRKIDGKKRISKTVHLTNILKNDQRYKALYAIWCLVQKEKQKEQQEKQGASSDLSSNSENYYATYSALSLLYAMSLLGIDFDAASYFDVDSSGKISVRATAHDERFCYTVKDCLNEYGYTCFEIDVQEIVDVAVQVPQDCSINEIDFFGQETVVTFSNADQQLHFHKKPNSEERTALRNTLHKPQSEFRRMSKQEKYLYNRAIESWNAFLDNLMTDRRLHNPRKRPLRVAPILFDVQADSAIIKKFTDDLFENDSEYICYLLPHSLENYREIKRQELLRRLFNYGEAFHSTDKNDWKNYKLGVLPVMQTDIGTIQRLMKFISLHRSKLTMELEGKGAVHCPVCGQTHIRALDASSWKCENPECGIEWGETRCTKGCKEYFHWIKPDSEFMKEDFDWSSECNVILKKDSLFDRYIITDFEFQENTDGSLRAYPVCPKCGTRRFEKRIEPC